MIKVAIAILNWNGKDILKQFLPSVIQFSNIDESKIFVIDNASTDDSVEYINLKFPEVEVIQLDENYGFAEGYNRGLKKITARYYLLLNSDVEVTENWIIPLVSNMDDDLSVAACMPKIRAYRRRSHFEYAGAAGGYIDKYGFPFCQGRIFDFEEKDIGQYNKMKSIFWITGACFMIRSDIFTDVGGFDDDFFAHMEEIDMCWRLKNRGYKLIYIPQSVVYHFGGATLSKSNPRKTFLNFRNNLFLLYKNLPKGKLIKTLLARYIFDFIALLLFVFEFKFKDALAISKAHFAFFKSFKKLRNKRKILAKDVVTDSHNEMLNKSLVFQFYLRRRKTFKEINF